MRSRYLIAARNETDYLFIVVHHLAVDGVSWRICSETCSRARTATQ